MFTSLHKGSLYILFFSFFITFILPQSAEAFEPAQVLFVNQIRGSENCKRGSFENTKKQVNTFVDNNIPAYFALRYDALKDKDYSNYFLSEVEERSMIIKLAGLLEITPQLARDAGVSYQGEHKNCYEAQNFFTLGYSSGDRRKLIDTYFIEFHSIFHTYPQLTVSWIIDTESYNYIHDNYHVLIHEITREQWGTDSYTLYGGPEHYPYPPSQNWIFMPDYQRDGPGLIVRQTVDDPLFNYGDNSNSFTSQPNDYLRGYRTFDYFRALFFEDIKQYPAKGFALLGLENSQPDIVQREFFDQIKFISSELKTSEIEMPDLEGLVNYWSKQRISLYTARNLIDRQPYRAYWINTPNYRLRIKVENKTVSIDDVRLYDPNIKDPYTTYIAKKNGYWIAPYLIDGSLWNAVTITKYNSIDKIFSHVNKTYLYTPTANDFYQKTTSIILPQAQSDEKINPKFADNSLSLPYVTNKNKTVVIHFYEDKIDLEGVTKNDIVYRSFNPSFHPIHYSELTNGFKIEWFLHNTVTHSLQTICASESCGINFLINPDAWEQLRTSQSIYVFPESAEKKINDEIPTIFVTNTYTIARSWPIYVSIIPKNKEDLPLFYSANITLESYPALDDVSRPRVDVQKRLIYFTVQNGLPLSTNLNVSINNTLVKTFTLTFAPSCTHWPIYCLLHPGQVLWYFKTVMFNRFAPFMALKETILKK